jgi:hypothetical protein
MAASSIEDNRRQDAANYWLRRDPAIWKRFRALVFQELLAQSKKMSAQRAKENHHA